MPLFKLYLPMSLGHDQITIISKDLSNMVAQTLGKPEKYVMIIIEQASIMMSGSNEPAAFADVRSIGSINCKTAETLSDKLCKCLKNHLLISPERVYSNFSDINADLWGWNEKTFG